MLIRAATPTDVPSIKALWNAMIRDTTATFTTIEKTDEDLLHILATRQDAFLVAEETGHFAGFVTWGPFRAGPGYAHTAEHTVITAASGRGTGRALLTAAMQQALAQGIHVMVAGISGENSAAVAFHRGLGFANTGQLPQVGRKDGRWIDLILMSKVLDKP